MLLTTSSSCYPTCSWSESIGTDAFVTRAYMQVLSSDYFYPSNVKKTREFEDLGVRANTVMSTLSDIKRLLPFKEKPIA